MLSPETFLFPAPHVTRTSLLQARHTDVFAALRTRLFYHNVSIVYPCEKYLPDSLFDATSIDNDFYKIIRCPALELIQPEFIDFFINKGKVSCLSINTHSDIDNCIAITENGTLILHVIDKLYEELSIDGIKSSNNFFEICINLKDSSLKSNKYFSKLRNCLNKIGSFDFIIKWKPQSDDICPSSIAKYLCEKNINVRVKEPEVKLTRKDVNKIPELKMTEVNELVEWVGMVAMDCDLDPKEPYISMFYQHGQEDYTEKTTAAILTANGFFTHEDIMKIYNEIVKYNSFDDNTQWAAISFQAFTDSPHIYCQSVQFQTNDTVMTILTNNVENIIHKTVVSK